MEFKLQNKMCRRKIKDRKEKYLINVKVNTEIEFF